MVARASFVSTLLALTASVIFATFVALPTRAATGLSIQPVKISQTLQPGETVSGTILLTNASDQAVQVDVTLQDFIPVAGAEGIQFVGRTEGVTTVRDWIQVRGKTPFLFKQNESREIPYTISAPRDAEPGSHFGVVFFKASIPSNTSQIRVGTQVGVLVLVTIPGAHLQKGLIRSFGAPGFVIGGPVPFTVEFENTGTVYFEPKGEIAITNMLGQKVGSVPIEGQVVLPTGVKNLQFSWEPGSFLFGRYSAVATIKDGEGTILTSKEVVFYAAPLWYIGFFVVSVVVLYLLLRLLRRHVRITLR